MRNLLIIALFLFAINYSNIHAQNKTPLSTEELKEIYDDSKADFYDYKYSESIKKFYYLIEEAQKSNNVFYEFRSLLDLGFIHQKIKDSTKAISYSKKALELAIESKTDSLIAWAYNDLANVQDVTPKNYKKMIGYYKKSIEISKKHPYNSFPIAENMNIADVYLSINQQKKAYPYLLKAQGFLKQKKFHELFYLNLNILFGHYYYSIKDYPKAIEILESKLDLAERKYFEQASKSYSYLAKSYAKTNNYNKSIYYLEKEIEFNKKLSAIEKETLIAETNARYEVEAYQKEIDIINREKEISNQLAENTSKFNRLLIFLAGLLFVGLLTIFGLYKVRKNYIKQLSQKNEELVLAKDKAEQLSKLKTQFFSTVSHEIRTPLYGVIGLSSILLEDKKLESHKEDLTSLKFSADYLLALINDVLMLSKMESNGLKLEKTPFKLDTLVNNITSSFAFILEQNNNKIISKIDPKLPNNLIGDSIRLSQILMNLIGNATKFNENGTVWITIELVEKTKEGHYLSKFTIKDDGIGIPEKEQKTIFEEFSQVQNDNYSYQGTGLGLPIVVKLLALHGSKINLESKPSEGATFSFTIPLVADLNSESISINNENDKAVLKQQTTTENKNILVVDDNKINQKITKKILDTKGYTCAIANDGKEAINLVKIQDFDLILMDINMPEIDGLEATKIIRDFNTTTPIIALTAVEDGKIREKSIVAGMNDLILKPYDNLQFFSTILRHLNTL